MGPWRMQLRANIVWLSKEIIPPSPASAQPDYDWHGGNHPAQPGAKRESQAAPILS